MIKSISSSGYSLLEIMTALGVASVAMLLIGSIIVALPKYQKSVTTIAKVEEFKSDLQLALSDNCSFANSIYDTGNSLLQCLRDGSDCTNQEGMIDLYDKTNQIFVNSQVGTHGFDPDGKPCNSFDETNGNDLCPFRWEVKWKPLCFSDCVHPQIELEGTLFYSPGQTMKSSKIVFNSNRFKVKVIKNFEKSYPTCRVALADGKTENNIYTLDPDGAGGICPFKVYCDMTSDGGGWALIVNSHVNSYPDMYEAVVPTPVNFGRLNDEKISSLLQAVDSSANNVKIDVKTPGLPQTVSFKVNTHSKGTYVANDVDCSAYHAPDLLATFTAGDRWGFYATSGGGMVGFFEDDLAETPGFDGFACDACSSNTSCGNLMGSCCSQRSRGSVWIR